MQEYILQRKDYAKYPFLESFSKIAPTFPFMQLPLARLLETPDGKKALEIAKTNIIIDLNNNVSISDNDFIQSDKDFKIKVANDIPKIIAFGLSRMIISCTTQFVIEKFADKESERAMYYLRHEPIHIQNAVYKELNYIKDGRRISLKEYISLNLIRYDKKYKLVNCDVVRGSITVQDSSLILKEKIKQKIMRKLPINVNPESKELFKPILSEIMKYTSNTFSDELGDVNIENFPPCINNIISMINKKENPTHFGRFALVSFCNKAGMSDTEIVSLFQTVKDFEISTSLYQVEHITGKKGGTVYAAPACAAMKTNNLCRSGTDPLCAKVKHPLGYYASMQKRKKKQQKPL